MNAEELSRNQQLTEHVVKDLNQDPKLPFDDASFDVITNAGVNVPACSDAQPGGPQRATHGWECCAAAAAAACRQDFQMLGSAARLMKPQPRPSNRWPNKLCSLFALPPPLRVALYRSFGGLPHPPTGGVPRDAPRAEAGGARYHELLQPLLPHQGCARLPPLPDRAAACAVLHASRCRCAPCLA